MFHCDRLPSSSCNHDLSWARWCVASFGWWVEGIHFWMSTTTDLVQAVTYGTMALVHWTEGFLLPCLNRSATPANSSHCLLMPPRADHKVDDEVWGCSPCASTVSAWRSSHIWKARVALDDVTTTATASCAVFGLFCVGCWLTCYFSSSLGQINVHFSCGSSGFAVAAPLQRWLNSST